MVQIERNIVQQVLGTLMEKPTLLNDTDKFNLEISDFPNQIDRFIFSAIYNLYVGGAELIHTVDIDNYLKENPLARELIEKEMVFNSFKIVSKLQNHKTFNIIIPN